MQKFPKILKKNWGFYVWTNHLFWYKKASLKKGRHICFNARSINHFNTRAKLTEISWTTLIKSKTHNKWIGNVTKATDFWVVLTCPSFVTWPRLGGGSNLCLMKGIFKYTWNLWLFYPQLAPILPTKYLFRSILYCQIAPRIIPNLQQNFLNMGLTPRFEQC